MIPVPPAIRLQPRRSRRSVPSLALLCLLAAAPLSALAEDAAVQVPQSPAEVTLSYAPVVRAAAPAVVNIYARKVVDRRPGPFADDPFFSQLFGGSGGSAPQVENSLGSGVILSPEGIVVSNYHVVGEADDIRVVLNDRREFDAEVLLADQEADLAVLRLKGASGLPALRLRHAPEVAVGDLVLAIGNPFGIGQTVSGGIVSGLARSLGALGQGRGYFIQTDAAINPGNSGGALVDMRGQLVGINTAILSRGGGSNGIGFAIPADLVAQFVAQAEAGAHRFTRPWAGMTGQAVDAALAEGLGLPSPQGMAVAEVAAESPFAAAGIEPGDVLVSVGGAPVNTPQEMMFRLAVAGVGAEVPVAWLRDGKRQEARVALIAPPELPPRAPVTLGRDSAFAGLAAVRVNPAVAAEYGLDPAAEGVMITDPGPLAGRIGLRTGDILLAINGTALKDTADLRRAAVAHSGRWQIDFSRDGQRSAIRLRM